MSQILTAFELLLLIVFGLPVVYLLFLMVAAAFYRAPGPTAKLAPPGVAQADRFIVLVPAHDESLTLPASLVALKALELPDGSRPRIVVVADNCTDNTAQIAAQAGVIVYERHDPTQRGKGQALQWAIERLNREYEYEALVIFDADTLPDPAFLKEAAAALDRGGQVLQGRYDVLKEGQSWRAALLYTAFVLYNHIRPLGRVRLGLSDGLRGNGMVFRREVLERLPWEAFSLVEDIEYTTRLALAGLKVTYLPQARLYGQAATTAQQASSQRMRWEGGRWRQARQDIPPLMRRAITKRDWVAFDRAFDLIIPPLALLAIGLGGLTFLNLALWLGLGGSLGWTLVGWLGMMVGLSVFVFGGLAVARAPRQAYLALLSAPLYILWKVQVYARMLFRRAPQQWVRTGRAKIELGEAGPHLENEVSR